MTAAQAKLDVVLESFQLVFEPTLLILQLFDSAICPPQFVFEPVYPQHEGCRLALACLLAWHVSRRRGHLRHVPILLQSEEVCLLRANVAGA